MSRGGESDAAARVVMVCNLPPSLVGSDYEVLVGHVERPPPAPSEVAPLAGMPPARALAKSRDERFAGAIRREHKQP